MRRASVVLHLLLLLLEVLFLRLVLLFLALPCLVIFFVLALLVLTLPLLFEDGVLPRRAGSAVWFMLVIRYLSSIGSEAPMPASVALRL